MPSKFMGFRKVTPEMKRQRLIWEIGSPTFGSKRKKKKKQKVQGSAKARYKDYLKSEHWKQRKIKYWKKYNRVCFCCGEFAVLLHHITYARLNGELDKDLIPLCNYCHEKIHKDILKKNPKLKKAHLTLRDEIDAERTLDFRDKEYLII